MTFKNKQAVFTAPKVFAFCTSLLKFLLIFGICVLFLFPLFYCIIFAFQSPETVTDPSVILIPKEFSLESIKTVWNVMNVGRAYSSTLISAVFSTVGTLFSCSLAGYSIARYNYKEKPLIFILVILMIVIPPQALETSQFLNYSFFDFGGLLKIFSPITGVSHISLIDTLWVYILPAFFAQGLKAGIFIFIFRQFFLGIPKNLEEAAWIDGCGPWGTFLKIVVPITMPAFVTVIIFSVVWHWTDYYNSVAYFTEQQVTLGQMIKGLGDALSRAEYIPEFYTETEIKTYSQAATFLIIMPLTIMFIVLQRFFTESIERTGLVG